MHTRQAAPPSQSIPFAVHTPIFPSAYWHESPLLVHALTGAPVVAVGFAHAPRKSTATIQRLMRAAYPAAPSPVPPPARSWYFTPHSRGAPPCPTLPSSPPR